MEATVVKVEAQATCCRVTLEVTHTTAQRFLEYFSKTIDIGIVSPCARASPPLVKQLEPKRSLPKPESITRSESAVNRWKAVRNQLPPTTEWMTVSEIASCHGVSLQAVYGWIERKRLPAETFKLFHVTGHTKSHVLMIKAGTSRPERVRYRPPLTKKVVGAPKVKETTDTIQVDEAWGGTDSELSKEWFRRREELFSALKLARDVHFSPRKVGRRNTVRFLAAREADIRKLEAPIDAFGILATWFKVTQPQIATWVTGKTEPSARRWNALIEPLARAILQEMDKKLKAHREG